MATLPFFTIYTKLFTLIYPQKIFTVSGYNTFSD